MTPQPIEKRLRAHHGGFKHHIQAEARSAHRLAQWTTVSGSRVGKLVALRVDGKPALAVVAASQRVDSVPEWR